MRECISGTLDDLIYVLESCPWLWWLGLSPGLRSPNRRLTDRSILLKVVTVLIVPLLTAAGAGMASWYGMQKAVSVLEEKVDIYNRNNDYIEQQHENRIRYLEQRLMK